MGCGRLDTPSGGGDESFDGGGVEATCEFLFFGFDAGDDGDGEEVFVDLAVELEDLADFGVGFCLCEVRGVAFLPEELAGSEERLWGGGC